MLGSAQSRRQCGGAAMDDYHKDTYTWGAVSGLATWLFSGSILWGIIIALLVGYYVEARMKDTEGEDDVE